MSYPSDSLESNPASKEKLSMDATSPNSQRKLRAADIVKAPKVFVTRRDLMKIGLMGAAATTLSGIDALAWAPARIAQAATTFPDIQFDIGSTFAPVQTFNLVQVRFGPVYTIFLTAKLNRTPSKTDQTTLANALNTIESHFAFSPSGIFVFTSYGVPYFSKLP